MAFRNPCGYTTTQLPSCWPGNGLQWVWQKIFGKACNELQTWQAVSRQHEAVKQEFIHLGKLAFGQLPVVGKPKILCGCGMKTTAGTTAVALQGGGNNRPTGTEARGDIAIDRFWKSLMMEVFNLQAADPNAKTYHGRSPVSVLQKAEWEKVQKYTEPCKAMQFITLMYLVACVPRKETQEVKKFKMM